jgi:ketosteroid isomerase-like protein
MTHSDPVDERHRITEASWNMANAIARRDLPVIRDLLAAGFVHRTPGGAGVDVDAFIRAIEQIPGEIVFVKLEQLEIDISGSGALVTGIQHAQVRVDGTIVDDRRAFVDWFVKDSGRWRIRAAVDLPSPEP